MILYDPAYEIASFPFHRRFRRRDILPFARTRKRRLHFAQQLLKPP